VLEEGFGKHGDIGGPLPEWRDGYRYNIDPVEEVLPVVPLIHQLAKVLVGRRDNPDVCLYRTNISHTLNDFFLQYTQKLHLGGEG